MLWYAVANFLTPCPTYAYYLQFSLSIVTIFYPSLYFFTASTLQLLANLIGAAADLLQSRRTVVERSVGVIIVFLFAYDGWYCPFHDSTPWLSRLSMPERRFTNRLQHIARYTWMLLSCGAAAMFVTETVFSFNLFLFWQSIWIHFWIIPKYQQNQEEWEIYASYWQQPRAQHRLCADSNPQIETSYPVSNPEP